MMRALLARELRLAWRSGAEILNPLWFFLIVITLFPFGVGAAPQLLAQIAPGVVWVAALLAALLVMDRLFRDDWQDGSLEQLMLLPTPLVAVVLVKVVAHWMMSGLPLLIVAGAMLSELDFSPDARIYMVVVMLSLLEWPKLARLVRGQCLSLRERDFMLATRVLGLSARRRLFGHLLPNTIPILVVMATMAVANAILSESALSYLGLGVVPPTPSWGNMMDAANSLIDFQRRPWLWMPPGIAIFITVIAINVLGDGLRDAMDPKMKQRLK